jgi:isopropanol dehydrogenase (NADP+)
VRGYVLKERGKAVWEDVPVPEIGPYDALVRPTAAATCTTDVHAIATLTFPNMLQAIDASPSPRGRTRAARP